MQSLVNHGRCSLAELEIQYSSSCSAACTIRLHLFVAQRTVCRRTTSLKQCLPMKSPSVVVQDLAMDSFFRLHSCPFFNGDKRAARSGLELYSSSIIYKRTARSGLELFSSSIIYKRTARSGLECSSSSTFSKRTARSGLELYSSSISYNVPPVPGSSNYRDDESLRIISPEGAKCL